MYTHRELDAKTENPSWHGETQNYNKRCTKCKNIAPGGEGDPHQRYIETSRSQYASRTAGQ
jgi:hypothetical protein